MQTHLFKHTRVSVITVKAIQSICRIQTSLMVHGESDHELLGNKTITALFRKKTTSVRLMYTCAQKKNGVEYRNITANPKAAASLPQQKKFAKFNEFNEKFVKIRTKIR